MSNITSHWRFFVAIFTFSFYICVVCEEFEKYSGPDQWNESYGFIGISLELSADLDPSNIKMNGIGDVTSRHLSICMASLNQNNTWMKLSCGKTRMFQKRVSFLKIVLRM